MTFFGEMEKNLHKLLKPIIFFFLTEKCYIYETPNNFVQSRTIEEKDSFKRSNIVRDLRFIPQQFLYMIRIYSYDV